MVARKRWHVWVIFAAVALGLYGIMAVWGMTDHDRYEGLSLLFEMIITAFGTATGGVTQLFVLGSANQRLQRRVFGACLSFLLAALIAVLV